MSATDDLVINVAKEQGISLIEAARLVDSVMNENRGSGRGGFDDGGDLRPGERRREDPDAGRTRERAEEFRKIREQYTGKSVEEVAAAGIPRDSRKRAATPGGEF